MSENQVISGYEDFASQAEENYNRLVEANRAESSLYNKIKAKTHELEKLQSELSLEEKDLKYEKYLYEQKTAAIQKKTLALDLIDNEVEKEKKKIEDKIEQVKNQAKLEIENLENKIEKIKAVSRQTLDDLQNKMEFALKKFEVKKASVGKVDETINYYERELGRLNSDKKETPKIRGIQADIIALYKELHQIQIQRDGYARAKCDLPFFPPEINQEVEKKREEYLEKHPVVESGRDKAIREMNERKKMREENPNWWQAYGAPQTTESGNIPIIQNTKKKRQPKTVAP